MPGADQATVLVDRSPGQVRAEVPAAAGDRKVLAVSVTDGVPADTDDPAGRQFITELTRCADIAPTPSWGIATATVSIS